MSKLPMELTPEEVSELIKKKETLKAEQGKKDDTDKVRTELLPADALIEVAKVLTFGAKKYDPWNWKKGMNWSRLIGACFRHMFSWVTGEDKDPESGLSHLAHASCCVLFLLDYSLHSIGKDDRYKGAKNE